MDREEQELEKLTSKQCNRIQQKGHISRDRSICPRIGCFCVRAGYRTSQKRIAEHPGKENTNFDEKKKKKVKLLFKRVPKITRLLCPEILIVILLLLLLVHLLFLLAPLRLQHNHSILIELVDILFVRGHIGDHLICAVFASCSTMCDGPKRRRCVVSFGTPGNVVYICKLHTEGD